MRARHGLRETFWKRWAGKNCSRWMAYWIQHFRTDSTCVAGQWQLSILLNTTWKEEVSKPPLTAGQQIKENPIWQDTKTTRCGSTLELDACARPSNCLKPQRQDHWQDLTRTSQVRPVNSSISEALQNVDVTQRGSQAMYPERKQCLILECELLLLSRSRGHLWKLWWIRLMTKKWLA